MAGERVGERVGERLPTNVAPLHYKIELKIDLKKLAFEGQSVVTIKVLEPCQLIVLNALDLEIASAEYVPEHEAGHKACSISTPKDCDRASIKFDAPLSIGKGQLKIAFSGKMSSNLKGFYSVKQKSADGEEKYGGVTQFEATDARMVFPCWDEPSLKATFDLTLIVPKELVALSNTNVIRDTEYAGCSSLHKVTFATTPKMSTYLVGFVVGDYDYVETTSTDGVVVRVYVPVGKQEYGKFALEVAAKALAFYSDYFSMSYPLPKLDLVAVPDLAAGAMENWGLVTFRESLLLADSQNSSAEQKQRIALIVSHELAHQWFGNIVTLEWWTHLWLNEGFATFIEFLCVNHLFPKFDIWTQFVADCYLSAMELDALHSSHPIEVPVWNPNEIEEIFDDISYNKGASVIRMLHAYIGDENFKKGMNFYLTKHKYSNTTTEDLWHSLAEACTLPVEAVMDTWVKQKGFPVISVSSRHEGNNRILMFSQEKFTMGDKSTKDGSLWMVPISISTSKAPTSIVKQILLDSASSDVVLEDVAPGEWVKINVGTVGCYRSLYSVEMMEQLVPAIRSKAIPPLDRLGIHNDTFALVQSGCKSTVEVLQLMEAYVEEDNFNVWRSIDNCLGKLNQLLSHTDMGPLFHAYGRRLLAVIFSKVGWDPKPDEDHVETLLRSTLISRLARFKDEAVLAEAKRRFDAHVAGTAIIPADIRGVVYRAAALSSDQKMYNTLLKLYRNTDLSDEKDKLSKALASVTDAELIQATLEFALSDEVKNQDSVFVIACCSMTAIGRDFTWRFFQNKKECLKKRFSSWFLISRLVKCILENFASEEKALEIEAFFRQNTIPGVGRTVEQCLESIRLNAAWLARDTELIRHYLLKN